MLDSSCRYTQRPRLHGAIRGEEERNMLYSELMKQKLYVTGCEFHASHNYPLPIIGIRLTRSNGKIVWQGMISDYRPKRVIKVIGSGKRILRIVCFEFNNTKAFRFIYHVEGINTSIENNFVFWNIYGDPTDNMVLSIEQWR